MDSENLNSNQTVRVKFSEREARGCDRGTTAPASQRNAHEEIHHPRTIDEHWLLFASTPCYREIHLMQCHRSYLDDAPLVWLTAADADVGAATLSGDDPGRDDCCVPSVFSRFAFSDWTYDKAAANPGTYRGGFPHPAS